MAAERLQKVLARAGVGSRRQIEEWIRQGRVTVNGSDAQLGQRADLEADAIRVDGKRVRALNRPTLYLVLNKPRGVVSTLHDPEGRNTVLQMIPEKLHKGLVTVGRLDWDSEGLLLLTDDGDFAQRLTHPRYGCVKTYEVKVKERPKESAIERLRQGIVLDGKRTASAGIEAFRGPSGARETSANSWWRVRLGEGRPRQIREMFHRIGHPVQRLRRVAIGPLTVPDLPRGSWRELTADEVARLKSERVSAGQSPDFGSKRGGGRRGASAKPPGRRGARPAGRRERGRRGKAGDEKGRRGGRAKGRGRPQER
ncbi:MAG: pseudouridine synthase [Acidobacteriota bacterium]